MVKASDNAYPSLLITEGTEPSAPAAGKQRLYIDSTSHHLMRTNSSGTETDIEGATSGDFSSGALRVPVGTGALTTTEGYVGWQSTNETLRLYDGQRERAIGVVGWQVVAYPINYSPSAALTTAKTLAANGGSLAMNLLVNGHMLLESVRIWNTDTGTARTWGWDLYLQDLNNGNAGENTVRRVAACSADDSFTPGGAASARTLTVGSAPVYIAPGAYWLVVQCRHATNNFGLGSTAAASSFTSNSAQTKTTTNPNGATLDLVAATWTKTTEVYAAVLRGRVLGQTSGF